MADGSLRLWLARKLIRRLVARAARRGLVIRGLRDTEGRETRWLAPEIEAFVVAMTTEADHLRSHAGQAKLPTFGSQMMVEMAIWTMAADRSLRACAIAPDSARQVVADLGWDIYRRMLAFSALPVRLLTRDSGRRLRWTIRALLVFPFTPSGAPGYAVLVSRDGDDLLTHFTHCPPQSFVRRMARAEDDPDSLEAFRQSWCRYDWPGADVIAGDGRRGHYFRKRTLSNGDPVCDMCWIAHAGRSAECGQEKHDEPATS
ncbi:hypothetical protein [Aliiroseovarius sp. F47248L]|uniref:hypothetical protein n=1 Tax=Aliiroseovarius sp. F47248L TaxID=2926420 RepID=UPI001FF38CD1|nr:hypothetical protein [Aliiroseovarius sp. F47248L]MCK0137923.1 hypothetical protein [Aliiroseovarius sp. F47248L]